MLMISAVFLMMSIIQCKVEKNNVKDKVKENTETKLNEENNTMNNKLKEDSPTDPDGLGTSEPGFNFTDEEMQKFKIWNLGVIPYYLDHFSFDDKLRDRLRQLLNDFNHYTGLAFTELYSPPKDNNERWVLFVNRRGVLSCEDYTTKSFTNAGVQRIAVGYDCLGSGGGALAATVLALAGVPPQHNAPDRDKYIDVLMDNIIPEKGDLFQVLKGNDWLFHDLDYDFLSAGHYDFHKYTINGSATIVPKTKLYNLVGVGEGNGISTKDILKIRMLYSYVSTNRGKAKTSDCSRLFKPGVHFRNYKAVKDDDVRPRKKPERYYNETIRNIDGLKTDQKQDNKQGLKVHQEDDKEFNVIETNKTDGHGNEPELKITNRIKSSKLDFRTTTTTKHNLKNEIKKQSKRTNRWRTTLVPQWRTQIFLKFDKSDYDTD